ncbi:protein MpKFB01_20 [Marchantia polymorpha subsp. ruderalis]|uniref:F-box domain-containing protein n=2 Tax=Marchantia polymorpha TaxID=3197 RepID=A0AAF6BQL7_MARPO|nr:hypothetical protein MARPO_0016s0093 [Marchantia polymorpha]BBN14301.1 hypothetical protein Mp_6g10520 [Marchantia polymorpha subsp. ruderalis]|eukprot:PTQ45035.1 hypothetical protein MARPO_0016s0093 [Marchantia polymorpha]
MTIWYGELTADCELPDYEECELEDVDLDGDCGNAGMEMDLLSKELLPGLPEDVALECLVRVSMSAFPQLQGVCRRWGQLVCSKDFYEERKKAGTTRNCVCIVQALPDAPDQSAGSPGVKHTTAPEFGITVYDWQNQSWSRIPCIPEFPSGLPLFCRLVAVDGKLLVLGGWHPDTYEALKSVYVFDFTSQLWKGCADMPCSRSFFACGALDGQVYVAGGHDDNKNALNTAEVYNLEENRWEVLPNMSEARDESGGIVLDGKFFVISGYGTSNQGQFTSSADSYDPITGEWTRIEDMWTEGVSPGPFAVSQGVLYAVQRQNLVHYAKESNAWAVVEKIPGEGRFANWITSTEAGILMMTLPSTADRNKSLIHQRPAGAVSAEDRSSWQLVETSDMFSGLGRAACTVDI